MQRSAIPVEGLTFVDKFGDERVVHHIKGPNGPLRVKRLGSTPSLELNRKAAVAFGDRVRDLRVGQGLSMLELAERAGLRGGKQAIWQLETGYRAEGARLGTVYALAIALGVEVCDLLPPAADVKSAVRVDKSPRLAVG